MNNALQDVVREISRELARELSRERAIETSGPANVVDLLLQRLAGEVVKQLRESPSDDGLLGRDPAPPLPRSLGDGAADGDEDEAGGDGARLPNLKYAKPKYQGVESVLKFVESAEGQGGLKIVIMNFND